MGKLFSTKTAEKSSQGNTCYQIFITDKGFVNVVPMEIKSKFLQAVNLFSKEIGSPDTIIPDAAGEQTSKALRRYCSDIGTTLRYLEEGNPRENKDKIFIGLFK